ncbi:Uncharacterised protein [Citrobacter freundii]|nr:Uncharacterised protein [Citrobacter freundii]
MVFFNPVSSKDSMQDPDVNNVKKTRNDRAFITRSAVFLAGILCSHGVMAGAPISGVESWVLRDFQANYALINTSSDIAGGVIRYHWVIQPNAMCASGTLGAVRDHYKLGVTVTNNYAGRFFILPGEIAGQINSVAMQQPVNVSAYFSSGGIFGNDGQNIAVGASDSRGSTVNDFINADGAQCTGGSSGGLDKTLIYLIEVPQGVLPAGNHRIHLSSRALYLLYIGLNGPGANIIGGAVLAAARPFLSSSAGTLSMTGEIVVNNYCRLESTSAEINHGTVSGNQVDGHTANTSFRVTCNNPITTKITATGLTSGNELVLGTGLKSTIAATVNGQSVDFSSPNKDYVLNGTSNLINLASTLHLKAGETLQAGDYNKSFVMNITYQ